VTEAEQLGSDLLRSAARLTRWASRHATLDVPMAQARLLALVEELGPARVSTLAEADHSSQPTMTTQLQRLEAAGWVLREPDPVDARASLISLTREGRAAIERARRARLDVLSPVLEGLDESQVSRLRTAVETLDELLVRASGGPHALHPSDPRPSREED
jgi:DNA-binding MarR family transcriptional regulator